MRRVGLKDWDWSLKDKNSIDKNFDKEKFW